MITTGIALSVLIKGKPINEYHHENAVYVEGRAGSNYELEVRNYNYYSAEVVVSVDGLSVLDGKTATGESRGYLLQPYGMIRIPGWKLDQQHAAKFAFAGKKDSYASQVSEGRSPNNGVIGVLAYREQAMYPNIMWNGLYSSPALNTSNIVSSGAVSDVSSVAGNASHIGTASWSAEPSSHLRSATRSAQPQAQSLGTAFGESMNFVTQKVSFQRGDRIALLSIYYDNLKGLRARGVPVVRTGKAQYAPPPQAFTGVDGCVPPRNWRA